MRITHGHVLAACEWAMEHRDRAGEIGGVIRRYDQRHRDTGKTCDVWGAASLLAGAGVATTGPDDDALGDGVGRIAVRLMRSSMATPEHIAAALRGECDANGNWRCTGCVGCVDCENCVDCDDCAECVGCTDCEGCTGCVDCTGCGYCRDCAGCDDCEDCMGCIDCTGCEDCRNCAGCEGCKDRAHGG